MERLPADICQKIFCLLDHQNLATAQQGNGSSWHQKIYCGLICFEESWGRDSVTFYAPIASKSWEDVYEVQDCCDRVVLGLKIIREGDDCYLIHQGEIQRHLGSRRHRKVADEGAESAFWVAG